MQETFTAKKYYPVMLDVSGKSCLVVGGGSVGFRKIISLLQYGSLVRVVSPDICEELTKLHNSEQIIWIKDNYKCEYLENIFLVFAAANNSEVNQKIYDDAKNKNIPVNIVDVPELCDFIMPAVFRQGDLTIAVSTNGKSPTLAKKICEDLSKIFGTNYAVFLDILGELREKAFKNIKNSKKRASFFKKIVYSDYLEKLKYSSSEDIKQEIELAYHGGQTDEK